MRLTSLLAILALLATACAPTAAPAAPAPAAQPAAASPTKDAAAAVADFYKGKTVTIIVGYDPGGGYDVYARTLANHIGKQIRGNPTVIVQNMPGAGSLLSANALYSSQPKDGTVIGTFGRGLPFFELLAQPEVKFESTKFNWIGSMNDEVSVCVTRADSGIAKFEDTYTKTAKVGSAGPDDDTGFFPRFLNGLLGTKFDQVLGYKGGNDINLAIERGEVQGRCGFSWSSVVATKPQWIKDKFVNVLIQLSLAKHPDAPKEVPLILEYAKDPDQKQLLEVVFSRQTMGRPFAAPPGVPAERVKALRDAFDATLKDAAFKADADKQKLELNPKTGAEVQEILVKIFQTPQALRERLKKILDIK